MFVLIKSIEYITYEECIEVDITQIENQFSSCSHMRNPKECVVGTYPYMYVGNH